tara:strand:- start:8 stop:604 length:597 start_codon:yes stop_codon:yes gene_type:complete
MFLKNENYLFSFFIIVFLLFPHNVFSDEKNKIKVFDYLNSLKNFSASFLQNDGVSLSEGKVYIGEKRVRAEYFSPTNILVILDKNKAMYYNYELEEDEFFDPKNTNAWFFYDIFMNPVFFEDGLVKIKNNELTIVKRGIYDEEQIYDIELYFENDPLVLRKIEIIINNDKLKLSIFNHSYNEEYDIDFFKLINPKLLN